MCFSSYYETFRHSCSLWTMLKKKLELQCSLQASNKQKCFCMSLKLARSVNFNRLETALWVTSQWYFTNVLVPEKTSNGQNFYFVVMYFLWCKLGVINYGWQSVFKQHKLPQLPPFNSSNVENEAVLLKFPESSRIAHLLLFHK